MKTLLALFALFPAAAHAYSLDCVGPSLSYSFARPDGGPMIAPTEQLMLDGRLVIYTNPFEHRDVREATFSLSGPQTLLGKPVRHDRYWVTKRFVQNAVVANNGNDPEFQGKVTCRAESYDGPPIP